MSGKPLRLDRYLVSQNKGSRKEVSKLIRGGLVTVDAVVASRPDMKILPGVNRVSVDGAEVVYKEYVYIMMNKPAGVLSASEDSRAKTVLDILPDVMRRRGLFPAGRLDKDTTGLLLITDDGAFAHKMLSPKSMIFKEYEVYSQSPVTEEDIKAFADGIELKHLTCLPAKLSREESSSGYCSKVRISEGKYHQVKRMYEARGNQVLKLKRLRIGNLLLDEKLAAGEARFLEEHELDLIFM